MNTEHQKHFAEYKEVLSKINEVVLMDAYPIDAGRKEKLEWHRTFQSRRGNMRVMAEKAKALKKLIKSSQRSHTLMKVATGSQCGYGLVEASDKLLEWKSNISAEHSRFYHHLRLNDLALDDLAQLYYWKNLVSDLIQSISSKLVNELEQLENIISKRIKCDEYNTNLVTILQVAQDRRNNIDQRLKDYVIRRFAEMVASGEFDHEFLEKYATIISEHRMNAESSTPDADEEGADEFGPEIDDFSDYVEGMTPDDSVPESGEEVSDEENANKEVN